MYAIFEDGSHQYRVSVGDTVRLDHREAEVGANLELGNVLLVAEGADLIDEEAGGLVEALEFLAVLLFEFGLVVPRIDVTRSAVHEQPDDGLRLAREVRLLRRQRVFGLLFGAQEIGQREQTESAAGAREEAPPQTPRRRRDRPRDR